MELNGNKKPFANERNCVGHRSGNRQLPHCLLFITPFYQLQNFTKILTGQMAIGLPFIFLIEKYLTHLLMRRFYYKHVELANGLDLLWEEEVVALIHNSIRPTCVLSTLVIQKSGQKSIEER
jgi:hypothetical protein